MRLPCFITQFRKCYGSHGRERNYNEEEAKEIIKTFDEFQQKLLKLAKEMPEYSVERKVGEIHEGKHERIIQFVNGVRRAKDKWKDAKIAGCIRHLQDYGQQLQEYEQDYAKLSTNWSD